MSELSVTQIEERLKEFVDPLTGNSILPNKALKNLTLVNGELRVEIILGYPAAGIKDRLESEIAEHLLQLDGVVSANVEVSWLIKPHAVQKLSLIHI